MRAQLSLFKNAKYIAGQSGSNLFSCLGFVKGSAQIYSCWRLIYSPQRLCFQRQSRLRHDLLYWQIAYAGGFQRLGSGSGKVQSVPEKMAGRILIERSQAAYPVLVQNCHVVFSSPSHEPTVTHEPGGPKTASSMPKPGIAIITYKRPDYLERCLSSIGSLTPGPHELIVMCDADDDEESRAVCQALGVDAVFAANRGVVWNKNRGLFHFMSRTDCDPIILLEDDACPVEAGWLDKWVEAAARWHHVNFSYPKLASGLAAPSRGDGTPGQPHVHTLVSGQCTAVSRHAMQTGGYLDTRFKGYGHGHVEWSRRHASLLYKGKVDGLFRRQQRCSCLSRAAYGRRMRRPSEMKRT